MGEWDLFVFGKILSLFQCKTVELEKTNYLCVKQTGAQKKNLDYLVNP